MDGFEKLLVVRGLRLMRLARVLRMVGRFKVVWRLVSGLLTAWDTMLSATVLIILWLFIFACDSIWQSRQFPPIGPTGDSTGFKGQKEPMEQTTLDCLIFLYVPSSRNLKVDLHALGTIQA